MTVVTISIIGIAAGMTIVSAINGYTEKTMEQYEAMGLKGLRASTGFTWPRLPGW